MNAVEDSADLVLEEVRLFFVKLNEWVPVLGEFLEMIMEWPEARHERIFDLSDAYARAAQLYQDHLDELGDYLRDLDTWQGDGGAEAVRQQFQQYFEEIGGMSEAIASLHEVVHSNAVEIEAMKWMAVINLVMLAVAIVQMIITAWTGVGALIGAGEIAFTRVAIKKLATELVEKLLQQTIKGGFQHMRQAGLRGLRTTALKSGSRYASFIVLAKGGITLVQALEGHDPFTEGWAGRFAMETADGFIAGSLGGPLMLGIHTRPTEALAFGVGQLGDNVLQIGRDSLLDRFGWAEWAQRNGLYTGMSWEQVTSSLTTAALLGEILTEWEGRRRGRPHVVADTMADLGLGDLFNRPDPVTGTHDSPLAEVSALPFDASAFDASGFDASTRIVADPASGGDERATVLAGDDRAGGDAHSGAPTADARAVTQPETPSTQPDAPPATPLPAQQGSAPTVSLAPHAAASLDGPPPTAADGGSSTDRAGDGGARRDNPRWWEWKQRQELRFEQGYAASVAARLGPAGEGHAGPADTAWSADMTAPRLTADTVRHVLNTPSESLSPYGARLKTLVETYFTEPDGGGGRRPMDDAAIAATLARMRVDTASHVPGPRTAEPDPVEPERAPPSERRRRETAPILADGDLPPETAPRTEPDGGDLPDLGGQRPSHDGPTGWDAEHGRGAPEPPSPRHPIVGTSIPPDSRPAHESPATRAELQWASTGVRPEDFSGGEIVNIRPAFDLVRVETADGRLHYFRAVPGEHMRDAVQATVTSGSFTHPHQLVISDRVAADQLHRVWLQEITRAVERPAIPPADPPWVLDGRPPSLSEVLPQTQAEAEAWQGAIRRSLSERLSGFEYGGARVRLDADDFAISVFEDNVIVRVQVVVEGRGAVGHATVSLHRDRDPERTLFAHYNTFSMPSDMQGGGFTRRYTEHFEHWLREQGVRHITVRAASTVGGYAWARLGFTWNPDASHHAGRVMDRLRSELAALRADLHALRDDRTGTDVDLGTIRERYGQREPADLITEIERQHGAGRAILDRAERHAVGHPGYPTPAEVARAGWNGAYGAPGTWLGKRVMLGTLWEGIKDLTAPDPPSPEAYRIDHAGHVDHVDHVDPGSSGWAGPSERELESLPLIEGAEAIQAVRDFLRHTRSGLDFTGSRRMGRFADALRAEPGVVRIALHGLRSGELVVGRYRMRAEDFALGLAQLQRTGRIDLGTGTIRLISCHGGTGTDSPAATLARSLGREVTGATERVWTYLDGTVLVASTDPRNGWLPRQPPDGEWRTYTPDTGAVNHPAPGSLPAPSPNPVAATGGGSRAGPILYAGGDDRLHTVGDDLGTHRDEDGQPHRDGDRRYTRRDPHGALRHERDPDELEWITGTLPVDQRPALLRDGPLTVSDQPVAWGEYYDPADLDPTPQPGETPRQAADRVAVAEVMKRYEDLGDEPPEINMARNDDDYHIYRAHTRERHWPSVPLRRGEAPPNKPTIEGRIYGDHPWDGPENWSYRWFDHTTMHREINGYIRRNWATIRDDLAIDRRHIVVMDAKRAVGEGFFNRGMYGTGRRDAQYHVTGLFRLTIRLVPGSEPARWFVVTAFPTGRGL